MVWDILPTDILYGFGQQKFFQRTYLPNWRYVTLKFWIFTWKQLKKYEPWKVPLSEILNLHNLI